jgi:predicted N-acetyltransferase YhbS
MGRVAAAKRVATTKKPPKLTRPAPLREGHNIARFDCGEDSLNYWLHEHALPAHAARTANTIVICRGKTVVGYASIANGAVAHNQTSAKVRRNTPDPIPATVIARLAVDKTEQGKGLGSDLLFETLKRALAATRYSAAKIIIVHPLNARSAKFYGEFGFMRLKGDTSALFLPMNTVAEIV